MQVARVGVEGGDAGADAEEVSVDVREPGQVLVEQGRAPVGGRVEDLAEVVELGADVGAVGAGAVLDVVKEDAARLEDPGVVREQAEDEADQHAV